MGLTAQIFNRRNTLLGCLFKPIGQVGLIASRVSQTDFSYYFLDHGSILSQAAVIYRDFSPFQICVISPTRETSL